MSASQLPEPPALNGEIMLDIFTHPSLRQPGGGGDNERYTALGEKVFEAVTTHYVFLRFPGYLAKEIADERSKILSNDQYQKWVASYGFREKLRCHPDAISGMDSVHGARDLFHAYVGGIYTQTNGPLLVNEWVHNLLLPPEERSSRVAQQNANRPPPPPNVPYPMPPPPPPLPPPSVPYPRSRTNSISSSRHSMILDDTGGYNSSSPMKVVFLPRFNEICTQRRLAVQYHAEQVGLQHAPRWVVKCTVDGQDRGQGAATTKQLAKEEAAKEAWGAMNFSMH